MSEAASHVDAEDAGVLNLLEKHTHTSDKISAANLSLTTDPSSKSAPSEEEIDAMVVSHDPTSHQARAVAALQQADTVSEKHQLENDSVVGMSQQPTQEKDEKLQASLPNAATRRTPTLPGGLKDESDITIAAMPAPKSTGESSMEVMAALTTAYPHSICLCQAPTRIPRPRNAFILFRQHHHAAVVAQYPGKPNPEISKIIGQMWKGSGDEVKAVWQNHADEEKRQHLQRYPQYRYQPRRSGKKNTSTVAADSTSLAPLLETAVCRNCGGRTGALPTPQTPGIPAVARKAPQTARNATTIPARKKVASPDNNVSRTGSVSGNGVGVEQAGIEALLQLGLQNEDDDMTSPSLQSPPKRRKLSSSMPPASTSLSGSSMLQRSLYTPQFGQSSDPNIDPYLSHDSFDHESPTAALESDGGLGQLSHFPRSSPDVKAVPILKKVHAISRICPPISSLSIPPFGTPTITRMPIISVDGDDVDVVADLYHALSMELEKSESVHHINEPDELTVLSEAYLEGLLSNTGLDKDKESDDADAARYLNHVAFWRRKSAEIRRIVMAPRSGPQSSNSFETSQPQLVLINRYILSRSDAAALRLSADGLSPLEHWQWCATIWRSCVGPDMTIYVQTLPEGSITGDDTVESKGDGRMMFVRKTIGGKKWEEKVVRRLGFEIGEIARGLRGFPG